MERTAISELPTTFAADLDQFKGMARRRQLSGMMGGHITRRLGQSLEFRDFGRYTLGDDIRHVDWRMSARTSGGRPTHDQWLLRRFHAEEQLKLTVSVDARETMLLPMQLPKLQIAVWIAEAITRVALESADRIVWHSLFGRTPAATVTEGNLRDSLQTLTAAPENDTINIENVVRHLPPTSVWVIITDLYFSHDQMRQLAEQVRRAQTGARWIMLLELDSWPLERHLLTRESTPVRLFDRGREKRIQPDASLITEADAQIAAHTGRFRELVGRASYDHEQWAFPADAAVTPLMYFRDRFLAQNNPLLRLFMRSAT